MVLLSDHKEALTGHSTVRRPDGGLSWFVFRLTVCVNVTGSPVAHKYKTKNLTGNPLKTVKEDSPTHFQGKWRLGRQ